MIRMTGKVRQLFILYGSQTGQAEAIANEIYEEAVFKNYEVKLSCLKDEGKEFVITESKCVIFICSTTGDGDPPENARKFIRTIRRKTLPDDHLAKLNYALLGLGDTNYSSFCGGPKTLEKALKQKGANSFYKSAFADDGTDMEETVEPWIDGLWPAVEQYFIDCEKSNDETSTVAQANDKPHEITSNGCPDNISSAEAEMKSLNILSDSTSLMDQSQHQNNTETLKSSNSKQDFSKQQLLDMSTQNTLLENSTISNSDLTLPPLVKTYIEMTFLKKDTSIDFTKLPYQNGAVFPMSTSGIIHATITCSTQLTSDDAVKRALEIELEVEDSFASKPGDSFAICCKNDVREVDWLIDRLSLNDVADIPANLSIQSGITKKTSVPPYIPQPFTIRHALTSCVEIRAVPKKPLVRALVECTTDPKEKRRLQELSSRQGASEYTQHVRIPNICVLDLLQLFSTCKPSFELLLQHLPRLQPRRYSITSSPLSKPNNVSFVFNVVTFEAGSGRTFSRNGVCTGFLERLTETFITSDPKKLQKVEIFSTKSTGFNPPDDPSIPLVMIGPGTGVAPFLGFLEHRQLLNKKLGEAWLFFGCRHRNRDFLYESELKSFHEKGILTKFDVAFSRDDTDEFAPKYVQDNLRSHSSVVVDLLLNKNAIFYVCGDAQNMAKDVRQCLIEIISKERDCDQTTATEKFKTIVEEKRYKEDLWT